ncbi:hypothetical protein ACHHYP_10434 [Achlya hypogyna]|uniref:FYVE-type domain-containing protein n=1 Tax=Achlya hypogyna TaxID=1202772 RepID=A0A1V9YLG4_ACHHY|nr:hypothetical protein ACHHYP_10434 [Achlya hypogyna]
MATDTDKSFASFLARFVHGNDRDCATCHSPFAFHHKQHKCRECARVVCSNCHALAKAKRKCGWLAHAEECPRCLYAHPPRSPVELPKAKRGLSHATARALQSVPGTPSGSPATGPCQLCRGAGPVDVDGARQRATQLESQIAALELRVAELQQVRAVAPVSDLEKENRRLKRQLEQAGMQVADDMSYAEAKARMTAISRRMAEIGSSDVTHPDKATQAALQGEYFTLEQEMEKCYVAMLASEEYELEVRAREVAWHTQHNVAHAAALAQVRRAIPVQVASLPKAALLRELAGRPDGPAFARRLKSVKALHLVRANPATLLVVHPCELVKLPFTKLCVLERQALYAALADVAAEWRKNDKNKHFADKLKWFKGLRDGLMRDVALLERHGPPDHPCDVPARCPALVESKAAEPYLTPGNFPSGAVFASPGDAAPMPEARHVAPPVSEDKAPPGPLRRPAPTSGVPMSLLAALQARKKD